MQKKDILSNLFRFGDDSASEQEVIESIERGVNFRGAKLWILIIAIFVASLGLNTNSAAVIIGAMLISPLMGPILGMGLGAGIYNFDLLRRSWRNYIVATIFSVLTATVYFFITPLNEAQSELLARTSPTIYDVLIALCGGLAGIIALSSHSQRTGNVIPGVAIATALMPPLCTVGFGLATANWTYAAGAFYLYLINTIFIALSTFIGAAVILKFQKQSYIDQQRETRVKRIILAIVVLTVLPAMLLTFGMVRKNYFEERVSRFIRHEMHFPMTHVVSHQTNYDKRSFEVVLIGNELDSVTINIARGRLPLYKLDGVQMQIIQGQKSQDSDAYSELLLADSQELRHAESIIAQQQVKITELEQQLTAYQNSQTEAPQLLSELKILFPNVESITLARGSMAHSEAVLPQYVALINLSSPLAEDEQERLRTWIKQRTADQNAEVILTILHDSTHESEGKNH